MSKPNEKTNDPATALYKVGYSYLSAEGFIRAGSIVIDTTSAEKAKEEATAKLANTKFRNVRITKVSTY